MVRLARVQTAPVHKRQFTSDRAEMNGPKKLCICINLFNWKTQTTIVTEWFMFIKIQVLRVSAPALGLYTCGKVNLVLYVFILRRCVCTILQVLKLAINDESCKGYLDIKFCTHFLQLP